MFPINGYSVPEFWYVADAPGAANVRAAAAKAAPGPHKRLVITGAFFSGTATAANIARAILNNDISGSFGNLITEGKLWINTNQANSLLLTGLNIVLPVNTPATAQFFSVTAATTQAVALYGYTIGE